jgi:hypothetical protein
VIAPGLGGANVHCARILVIARCEFEATTPVYATGIGGACVVVVALLTVQCFIARFLTHEVGVGRAAIVNGAVVVRTHVVIAAVRRTVGAVTDGWVAQTFNAALIVGA